MEKSLLCELMKRTVIGYKNAEKEMGEYLYSKFNTEIKEAMFRKADQGYNYVGFSISFRPSGLSDEEVKKIFLNIIIKEGFNANDIKFTRHWIHGFSGFIFWKEINE